MGQRFLPVLQLYIIKKSEDMGFFEYIGTRAAKDAIVSSDPRLLYGHNSESLLPIARKKRQGHSGKQKIKQEFILKQIRPKRNQFVDALIESIERGDIAEMSFGFSVLEDKWVDLETDHPTRTITKIGEIFDYSYVAFCGI